MTPKLLENLICPVTGQSLRLRDDGQLETANAPTRLYRVIQGVPCLTSQELLPNTHEGRTKIEAENALQHCGISDEEVDAFLEGMMVPTCGNAFHGWRKTDPLPIPDFDFSFPGKLILDIGCNWGRWSIAAAMQGYQVIAIDVHLKSLLVAQHLCKRLHLENPPLFILADARTVPIKAASLDGVFSYSVIQHFSRENAALILSEVGRTLKPGGCSVIQMPNLAGIRSMMVMARRRFHEGSEFDVRYYSINQLITLFSSTIGKSHWLVDCFFGLNLHARDLKRVGRRFRPVIIASALVNRISGLIPVLKRFADSVFIISEKSKPNS